MEGVFFLKDRTNGADDLPQTRREADLLETSSASQSHAAGLNAGLCRVGWSSIEMQDLAYGGVNQTGNGPLLNLIN